MSHLAPLPSMRASCGTCWMYEAENDKQGRCHAHPPHVVTLPVDDPLRGLVPMPTSVWTPVQVQHWCAEHSPRGPA